jgi:hypothetical protein
MIEKNNNIKKDRRINRIVAADPTSKQITILDSRYYQRGEDLFYPSVTYVLSYFPKDKFFETWMKDVGHNADLIMRKAGDEGTQVHQAIEKYLAGEEIVWIEENGVVNYSLDVWKMILKFVDFWQTYKPTLIESETHLFTDVLKVAGTGDLVVEIEEKLWLLDIKTSNSLHFTYDLQLSVYKQAWDELFDRKIDNTGILWLKAATRGSDKAGKKIQGAGWQLKPTEGTFEDNIQTFKHLFEIFKIKNPDLKPYSELLPTTVKL